MELNKRTKATMITPAAKAAVWERDGGRCLWCGAYNAEPNAHYIPRSRGGLGIEQNILTLCFKRHRIFDQPSTEAEVATSRRMKQSYKHYLKSRYPGWDEKKMVYRKDM